MPLDITSYLDTKEELDWHKVIKDYEVSGLSQLAYCNLKGVDYKGLLKWRRKLTKKEGAVFKERCDNKIKIAPIKLKKEMSSQLKTPIRLELPNKLNLYIPADFDSGSLKKILGIIS